MQATYTPRPFGCSTSGARRPAACPAQAGRHARQRPLLSASARPCDSKTDEAAACTLARRELLGLGLSLALAAAPRPAAAEPAATTSSTASIPAAAGAGPASQVFMDSDFQLYPPADFTYIDTQPVDNPDRRGPAPERSPVRARFDSPDGTTVISVVVQNAASIRASVLQITDVSALGSAEEAAKLLVPLGSTLLAANTLQVELPPRKTAIGMLEVPPKTYYRYEFTTPSGLHVFMSAAAQRGRVYVCGASTAASRWGRYGSDLRAAAESFHLRDPATKTVL